IALPWDGIGHKSAPPSATTSATVSGGGEIVTGNDTANDITTIVRPATTVVSISRSAPNPTTAASVDWTVVFANPLDGLTASNFALVNTGLGGTPAITTVSAVGS